MCGSSKGALKNLLFELRIEHQNSSHKTVGREGAAGFQIPARSSYNDIIKQGFQSFYVWRR
jgi:hypothetical protein